MDCPQSAQQLLIISDIAVYYEMRKGKNATSYFIQILLKETVSLIRLGVYKSVQFGELRIDL